jgi:hypothetical protein
VWVVVVVVTAVGGVYGVAGAVVVVRSVVLVVLTMSGPSQADTRRVDESRAAPAKAHDI